MAITIGGKSATANKVDLGSGLVYIGGHITLTNFTTESGSMNIGLAGLPAMSTVISCGIEGAQIGQASSYISYPHFYSDGSGASFYLRNTTSGTTSAIEINFHVFGVLSTS